MAKKLSILANGQPFSARPGDVLLDAALLQGIELPHDCRSGQCGSCLVRVLDGEFLGGRTTHQSMIHACQARVFSDAQVRYERILPPRKLAGKLTHIEQLAPDIFGLNIKLGEPSKHRPGQYYRFAFRGFPSRCYSPTASFVGPTNKSTLRLHVKVVRDGEVSAKLGSRIRPGHSVSLEGPFGSAFLRSDAGRRLVLVASGTGFAPIWAIAEASVRIQPNRPLLLIAGARRLSSLYMTPALRRLSGLRQARLIVTVDEEQTASSIVRQGTPLQHLPPLSSSDVVYAAGSPQLVDAVGCAASRVGAEFYADPFTASSTRERAWPAFRLPQLGMELKSRVVDWLIKQARKEKSLWQSDWGGELLGAGGPARPSTGGRASREDDFMKQLESWRA
jgi:NAD(P)H-flavin reductase/ferredoxin